MVFVRLGGVDVELVIHDPAATDADLARAAGLRPPRTPRPLVDLGLVRGQAVDAPSGRRAPQRVAATATVVGGLDAGARVDLGGGEVAVVGRAPGCHVVVDDPAVSRRHARIAVDTSGTLAVADAGSRNGTWLVEGGRATAVRAPTAVPPGAELRFGRSRLRIDPPRTDHRPTVGRPDPLTGTTPHNRPPRPSLPAGPDAVVVPHPPDPPGSRVPLGVVAVLGPLAMAGAMVWVLGNPAFALFALLSPVLAVGNHLEGRRRERRGSRAQATRWAADLARFRDDLATARATEEARRRAGAPDPAEVLRRAEQPAASLWERRPHHDDWLHLRVGTGDLPWEPPRRDERHGPRHPDVADAIARAGVLRVVPATVDLAGGGVVGVVGHRPAALALARNLLCQAAVHHGPRDLEVLVACGEEAVGDWDWTKWLPHVEDVDGGPRRLAPGRAAADLLAEARLERWRAARAHRGSEGGRSATLLVVVDGEELLDGRRAPVRTLLDGRGGPAAGIVVAATTDRLPASCTAVVAVDERGAADLCLPAAGQRVAGIDADGMSLHTAARAARALARFDDPELEVAGAGLPAVVPLLDLLGLVDPSPEAVARRWADAGADPRPSTPIGVDEAGPVTIDLAADGPHVLVAGTTGAGKSELLRSLVAGLAAGSSPDHLTFLLVDFKGGSAFDACARLPHTVGLVTDLDAHAAERALRCLDAELRHRERVLRGAAAADLSAYRSHPDRAPLPRLVVVVDEFATLRAELPGFVDALVGVAQRGRSLGVHLVLATQRPAGSVSDHIKANANLRVALRVQDVADSVDVVDAPAAAALPRTRPGRACLRLGPGELLLVQTALATTAPAGGRPPVEVRPFRFGPATAGDPAPPSPPLAGPTDLDRLVDAGAAAFAASGLAEPRRPWPPPLPARLLLHDLAGADDDGPTAVVGVADDPDRQQQLPAGWRPSDGNLVVHGVGGSGTTTTLLALGRALAARRSPADLQVFVLDGGAGELAALAALPHVAAVVGVTERERQHRLVRHLRGELDRRRAAAAAGRPDVVVLLDGVGRFLAEFDDLAGMEVLDAFARVFAEGPEVGVRMVVTAERAGALPAALTATVRQRWVHRVADAVEASSLGVGAGTAAAERAATLPPGRFIDVGSGLLVQVAVPAEGWAAALGAAASRWPASARPTAVPAIRELPTEVEPGALRAASLGPARPWCVPIGIGDDDGERALVLHEGDHVLVAGPGRSGRTTTLATIGAGVRRGCPEAVLVALAGRRSWLRGVPGIEVAPDVAGALAACAGAAAPAFLLVDDADALDDPDGALAACLATEAVHVVAAVRNDVARGLFQHWTRIVRRSRLGVLLRPDVDLDGDLLGATLPRRSAAPWVEGRGYLVVDGAPSLVQVARCKDAGP